jgi:type VII secretion protein EccE
MTATMSAVDPAPAGAPAGRDLGQQRTSRRALWGWILPIRVGQVAVWQLGVLAVVATLPWAPGPTVGTLRPPHLAVIAAAALAFLMTSFRIGGLCAYQWVAVYFAYRAHKKAKPSAKQTESDPKKAEQKPQGNTGKPDAANQPRGNSGNAASGAPRPGGPAPGNPNPGNPHSGFPNPGMHKTGNAPGKNPQGGNPVQWPGNPGPGGPQGRPPQANTPPPGRAPQLGPNGNRPGNPGPGGPGPAGRNPAAAHFGGPNPAGGGEFPDGDPLVALLPGLTTRRHIDRAGNRVGLANVDDGWTAVLRLASAGRPSPAALVSTMRSIYQRTDVPLSSVGLVVWTMPGPLDVDSTDRAPKAEPIRVFWLAVRYRPAEAPLAALARGGDELGAMRATASAAMRLAAELARVGLACSVLDEPELRQDLLIALGCDRASGSAINESWRTWTVGRIRQSCFGLRHSRDIVVALNRWAPGAAFSSTALLISRNAHGKVRRDVTVRIGLPRNPKAKPERLAAGLNIGLVPLHGRHARHVKASLPLGLRS